MRHREGHTRLGIRFSRMFLLWMDVQVSNASACGRSPSRKRHSEGLPARSPPRPMALISAGPNGIECAGPDRVTVQSCTVLYPEVAAWLLQTQDNSFLLLRRLGGCSNNLAAWRVCLVLRCRYLGIGIGYVIGQGRQAQLPAPASVWIYGRNENVWVDVLYVGGGTCRRATCKRATTCAEGRRVGGLPTTAQRPPPSTSISGAWAQPPAAIAWSQ